MRNILLFTSLLFIVTSSCKKESHPESSVGAGFPGMIKMTRTQGVTTWYYYNPDSTLQQTITNDLVIKYTYSQGMFTITSLTEHKFILNAAGLVSEEKILASTQLGVWFEHYYTYDNADYLIHKSNYDPNGWHTAEIMHYYSSGNEDSLTQYLYPYSSPGPDTIRLRFTRYYDKSNSITNANKGQAYFGKSDLNPVKEIYRRTHSNTDSLIAQYMYEFDPLGRITMSILTSPGSPNDTTWIEYY